MKLSDFIGEATEYDKKEMLEERKPKSWLKSVSAFANGIGGALFFGVSNDEVLVGLDDAKGVSEKISESIKTKMDPAPQVVLEIHAEDGKEFVILKVPAGQETPYYYTGDGNRIAYVRIGNESVPASAVDLKRLVLRGSNASNLRHLQERSRCQCGHMQYDCRRLYNNRVFPVQQVLSR